MAAGADPFHSVSGTHHGLISQQHLDRTTRSLLGVRWPPGLLRPCFSPPSCFFDIQTLSCSRPCSSIASACPDSFTALLVAWLTPRCTSSAMSCQSPVHHCLILGFFCIWVLLPTSEHCPLLAISYVRSFLLSSLAALNSCSVLGRPFKTMASAFTSSLPSSRLSSSVSLLFFHMGGG